jgi:hypothetical protein
VDGQGGVYGPLGGVFQSNRGAEKSHDAVLPEFLDRPLILLNLLGQEAEDLIDQGEGFLISQFSVREVEPSKSQNMTVT